jgi:hypothetical protein
MKLRRGVAVGTLYRVPLIIEVAVTCSSKLMARPCKDALRRRSRVCLQFPPSSCQSGILLLPPVVIAPLFIPISQRASSRQHDVGARNLQITTDSDRGTSLRRAAAIKKKSKTASKSYKVACAGVTEAAHAFIATSPLRLRQKLRQFPFRIKPTLDSG